MAKSFRVAFISHSAAIGGATRSLLYMARGVAGATVYLPEAGPIAPMFRDSGVNIRILRFPVLFHSQYESATVKKYMNFFLMLILGIRGIVSLRRFQIVHFNEIVFAPVLLFVRLLCPQVKIVMHVRVSLPKKGSFTTRMMIWSVHRFADSVLSIGPAEAVPFLSFASHRSLLNPVALPTDELSEARSRVLETRTRGKVSVGIFGQMHAGKGQIFLGRTLPGIPEVKNIEFFFFGDGPEKDNLVKLFSGHSNFFIFPFTNNVVAEMRSCDFILRAEENGMLGRDVLEANSIGLPVVAAVSPDIDYSSILAEGRNGFSFLPNDPVSLRHALVQMLDQYRVMRGWSVATGFGFSDEVTYKKLLLSVYEEICEQ